MAESGRELHLHILIVICVIFVICDIFVICVILYLSVFLTFVVKCTLGLSFNGVLQLSLDCTVTLG